MSMMVVTPPAAAARVAVAVDRLDRYLSRRLAGILDEPATARALARFLLRGLDCGALDEEEIGIERATLEANA